MSKRILLVVVAAVVGLLGFHVASATPPSGTITRTDLAKGTTTKPIYINTKGAESEFYLQSLSLGPGADSGWHTHPGPEYTIIESGTITIQKATACTPEQLGPGSVHFVEAGVAHRGYNETAEPVELYVTYTVPAKEPVRGETPDACREP
ncbi:MAG: cupin domain-containing protein [Acidimicrobiia bacterium]